MSTVYRDFPPASTVRQPTHVGMGGIVAVGYKTVFALPFHRSYSMAVSLATLSMTSVGLVLFDPPKKWKPTQVFGPHPA